ncbi:hypothetical protein HMSSN036_04940 [Paenibacillus macerans]|nr:hypothetical protein HMSSN036_04940 [Paenibacillus macerans]
MSQTGKAISNIAPGMSAGTKINCQLGPSSVRKAPIFLQKEGGLRDNMVLLLRGDSFGKISITPKEEVSAWLI